MEQEDKIREYGRNMRRITIAVVIVCIIAGAVLAVNMAYVVEQRARFKSVGVEMYWAANDTLVDVMSWPLLENNTSYDSPPVYIVNVSDYNITLIFSADYPTQHIFGLSPSISLHDQALQPGEPTPDFYWTLETLQAPPETPINFSLTVRGEIVTT